MASITELRHSEDTDDIVRDPRAYWLVLADGGVDLKLAASVVMGRSRPSKHELHAIS
jgi:hypothetical protein